MKDLPQLVKECNELLDKTKSSTALEQHKSELKSKLILLASLLHSSTVGLPNANDIYECLLRAYRRIDVLFDDFKKTDASSGDINILLLQIASAAKFYGDKVVEANALIHASIDCMLNLTIELDLDLVSDWLARAEHLIDTGKRDKTTGLYCVAKSYYCICKGRYSEAEKYHKQWDSILKELKLFDTIIEANIRYDVLKMRFDAES